MPETCETRATLWLGIVSIIVGVVIIVLLFGWMALYALPGPGP